ncbi:VOC family protein [Flavilitoribacter nigricans]|uniref:Glyoxalase n=1 Tax=Flavilitoribacter nigricans (strain ATCC 23147 / DSM 23189 / NBRC 102662 / NCIMB 1420 / SS-2) TaxID=1122177 RepID=A0A2D0N210_FLAN2|nr:VOC family protein [Flavilitoribacter nigricans]PHN02487.1 glyoxalase [Flavilitoribacter nigricans DSM 23189 = NBRC 102662]
MRFAHTNIISKNWRDLVAFYVDTFECRVVPPVRNQSGEWLDKGTGLQNAHLEGAHLLLPGYGEKGPTLEIYQYTRIEEQEPIAPNHRGFGHIAFEVASVELILKKLEQHGGSRQGEVTKRIIAGVGEITFVYARDPEGNLIELQSWQYEEAAE